MPNTVTASPTYYAEQLSKDVRFILKVQQVIMSYSLTVMAEALNTPNHAERLALAKSILNGNSSHYAAIIALVVVHHANLNALITITDGHVNTGATDGQLLAAITGQWNIYSGVPSGV